jgi:hypothetical protein
LDLAGSKEKLNKFRTLGQAISCPLLIRGLFFLLSIRAYYFSAPNEYKKQEELFDFNGTN